MGLKVTLYKSKAGSSPTQMATLRGLGLWRLGQQRLLKDTPAIRGMAFKVQHLVSQEVVSEEPKGRARRKPRRAVIRERARAARQKS